MRISDRLLKIKERKLLWGLLFIAIPIPSLSMESLINKNTVWSAEMSPILIDRDITVLENATLTISAGVIIKFSNYSQLLVKGCLIAKGEKQRPIRFTSAQEKPQVNDWKGLVFYGKRSSGLLSFCHISYSHKNICWGATPKIENCQFSQNKYALYCANNAAPRLMNNLFVQNTYGIYSDYSSPYIKENTIMNNYYGIYLLFSSSPLIGENRVEKNEEKDIYFDNSLGENNSGTVSNYVWGLIKDIF